ncbi:hypothetical protein [Nodosilinea sp. E11]|uniref:hypothetical protein n=1 Tax=Nodosilinea sp. E11 TaxID=3037479 RepID=UPI0029352B41|nr:hypothetical protein [Nodosilinea sp. E11]WOD38617.1 hypothetical protein RRF56_20620 [Nodosilinea sp. E11]
MSQSPFAQSLFLAACVSGAIFSAAAAPLAIFKSDVVNIELQNKTIYSSELKYLAGPYLALAGGVSAAIGFGAFGLVGWRQSSRKLSALESARQAMAHDLAIHQAELERIKFSEARLRSANLTPFLHLSQGSEPVSLGQASKLVPEAALVPADSVPAASAAMGYQSQSVGNGLAQPMEAQLVSMDSNQSPGSRSNELAQEPLDQLLSQLHQLSQQVEELRGGSSTNQLAA